MRVRSFRVPFSRVVPDDAHELEFGPDDYLVIRPLFGMPAARLQEYVVRIGELGEGTDQALIDRLVLDMLTEACQEWSLTGEDGQAISKPVTGEELRALPGALAGNLFAFLSTYRGDAVNPTIPR